MSQKKFVSLPVLTLRPSKILLTLIVILHTLAFASVLYKVYVHIIVNIFLGVLIVASFYYYRGVYRQLSTLQQLKYRADGMWILGFKDKPLLVSLQPDYMVTEWLIVLHFKVGAYKSIRLPIFYDMLPAMLFKKLRIVLPAIQQLKSGNKPMLQQG